MFDQWLERNSPVPNTCTAFLGLDKLIELPVFRWTPWSVYICIGKYPCQWYFHNTSQLHAQVTCPAAPVICFLIQQPLTHIDNPEHWSSVSDLVHKCPWKGVWTSKSSLQGARLKPHRVSLECGSLLDCWSSSLEPVLRPILTPYRWKSRMLPINSDVWNNTLSHMLFQAGLANPNYCKGNIWFWSRLTRKFMFVLQQWNMWSFMLAAHCHSVCVMCRYKGRQKEWLAAFYLYTHPFTLQCLQLISLGWKS